MLSFLTKKNAYYAWILTPGLSLVAAGVVVNLPSLAKKGWIVLCCIFAILHLSCYVSPLKSLTVRKAFELRDMDIGEATLSDPQMDEQLKTTALEVLRHATLCGPLEGRSLITYSGGSWISDPYVYFFMLSQDRRPVYWFSDRGNPDFDLRDFAVILYDPQKVPDYRKGEAATIRLENHQQQIRRQLRLVLSSPNYRVYCPRTSNGPTGETPP